MTRSARPTPVRRGPRQPGQGCPGRLAAASDRSPAGRTEGPTPRGAARSSSSTQRRLPTARLLPGAPRELQAWRRQAPFPGPWALGARRSALRSRRRCGSCPSGAAGRSSCPCRSDRRPAHAASGATGLADAPERSGAGRSAGRSLAQQQAKRSRSPPRRSVEPVPAEGRGPAAVPGSAAGRRPVLLDARSRQPAPPVRGVRPRRASRSPQERPSRRSVPRWLMPDGVPRPQAGEAIPPVRVLVLHQQDRQRARTPGPPRAARRPADRSARP